jgi:hypothetical protein
MVVFNNLNWRVATKRYICRYYIKEQINYMCNNNKKQVKMKTTKTIKTVKSVISKTVLSLVIMLVSVCVINGQTYCTPDYTGAGTTGWISCVKINMLNNTSVLSAGNYVNYSSGTTTSIVVDSTYSITIKSNLNMCYGLWIDFNQNGVFTDAGEHLFSIGSPTTIATKSITVPSSALQGQTRMRIRGAGGNPTDPCTKYLTGETEDYTITIGKNPNVTVSATSYVCLGQSVVLNASGADSYCWKPSTGLSSTIGSNVSATPNSTTTYTVVGTKNGLSTTKYVTVVVNQLPTKPAITQIGDTLISTPAVSYEWYWSGSIISGEVLQKCKVAYNGAYTVEITDVNGCTNTSNVYNVTTAGLGISKEFETKVDVFPNPVVDVVKISLNFEQKKNILVSLTDISGKILMSKVLENAVGQISTEFNVGDEVVSGFYLVSVVDLETNLKTVKRIMVK